jgi:50S ribosomal protein L16 3-hydroxylase
MTQAVAIDIDIINALELLGGISAQEFMQEYWQKKPLVIRKAIAQNVAALITKQDLFHLASQKNVTSRLLQYQTKNDKWQVKHGPFKKLPQINDEPWTILVSNVNEYYDVVHNFLQQFTFIPNVRLDDVMISYANNGGSVGAHFDSYDVFLFQGMGTRVWQISAQQDLTLIENSPLKLLKNFQPEQEYVLEQGDMLYLPPHYAHHGIAQGECMTYSVGFRAPALNELVYEYFMDMVGLLDDYNIPETLYTDPQQIATTQSGRIPDTLVDFLQNTLNQLTMPSVSRLLGTYLTRVNDEDIFNLPSKSFTLAQLKQYNQYISLHKASKASYDDSFFYINGEHGACAAEYIKLLQPLADVKMLDLNSIHALYQNAIQQNNKKDVDALDVIYEYLYAWYTQGWLTLNA